jgi:hypothetical protein
MLSVFFMRLVETGFELILIITFGLLVMKMIASAFDLASSILQNSLSSVMDKAEGWIKSLFDSTVGAIETALRLLVTLAAGGVTAIPSLISSVSPMLGGLASGASAKLAQSLSQVATGTTRGLSTGSGVTGDQSREGDLSQASTADRARERSVRNPLVRNSADAPVSAAVPAAALAQVSSQVASTSSQAGSSAAAGSQPTLPLPSAVPQAAQASSQSSGRGGVSLSDEEESRENLERVTLEQETLIAAAEAESRAAESERNLSTDPRRRIETEERMNESEKRIRTSHDTIAKETARHASVVKRRAANEQEKEQDRQASARATAAAIRDELLGQDPVEQKRSLKTIDKIERMKARSSAVTEAQGLFERSKNEDDGTIGGGLRSTATRMRARSTLARDGRTGITGQVLGAAGAIAGAMGPITQSRGFQMFKKDLQDSFKSGDGGLKTFDTPNSVAAAGIRAEKTLGLVGNTATEISAKEQDIKNTLNPTTKEERAELRKARALQKKIKDLDRANRMAEREARADERESLKTASQEVQATPLAQGAVTRAEVQTNNEEKAVRNDDSSRETNASSSEERSVSAEETSVRYERDDGLEDTRDERSEDNKTERSEDNKTERSEDNKTERSEDNKTERRGEIETERRGEIETERGGAPSFGRGDFDGPSDDRLENRFGLDFAGLSGDARALISVEVRALEEESPRSGDDEDGLGSLASVADEFSLRGMTAGVDALVDSTILRAETILSRGVVEHVSLESELVGLEERRNRGDETVDSAALESLRLKASEKLRELARLHVLLERGRDHLKKLSGE